MCFYIEYCSKSIHKPVFQVLCLFIKMHKMAINRPTIALLCKLHAAVPAVPGSHPPPINIANYKVNEISCNIQPIYLFNVCCSSTFISFSI